MLSDAFVSLWIKNEKESENRAKGSLFSNSSRTSLMLPFPLFIPTSNIEYFKIFYYSSLPNTLTLPILRDIKKNCSYLFPPRTHVLSALMNDLDHLF